MENAIPSDVYNKDGELTGIEFYKGNGEFIVFAQWDPTDEQTSENRILFRKWSYSMLRNMGYEVAK